MKHQRPLKGSDLQGNAWAFASIDDARAIYQLMLRRPGFISTHHDSSLDTGFFAHRPILIFLWGPTMALNLVQSVQHLATLAGGTELPEDLKEELLRQARLRWRALRSRRPRGGNITRHHPQGKVWTDLRD